MTDAPRPAHAPPTQQASEEAIEITTEVVAALDDKKGLDAVALDVAELLQITEVFVVVSGTSRPHVGALAEEVRDRLRERLELRPLRTEGEDEGEWVLLDFGSVVVHVFQPDVRGFYDLERLWSDAPRLPVTVGGPGVE